MDINYAEITDRAIAYAKKNNIELDFSEKSIEQVDFILGCYYDHLTEYDGKDGADILWNIAVHFGIYLGETLLRLKLKDKGYEWYIDDGIPILINANTKISPITKAHKRILNGSEDNVKSFCDVIFSIINGDFPTKNCLRVVDVELASGQKIENVLYQDINSYIMLVEKGKEDFLILNSHDGFLQFYGVDNKFVAEIHIDIPNNDFCTYSIIDKDKEHLVARVQLTTAYGQFTPVERDVISLELLKTVINKYYKHIDSKDLLKNIPCIETTEEIKRCMGLIE